MPRRLGRRGRWMGEKLEERRQYDERWIWNSILLISARVFLGCWWMISCIRRRDGPMLIFKKAIAKPLTRMAKFENFMAVAVCVGSNGYIVLP